MIKALIAVPAALLAVLYAGGYLAQFIGNYALWQQGGGFPGDGTSPAMASPSFSACFLAVFQPPYGIYGVFICIGLLGILLIMVMRMGYSDTGEYDEDRNFTYSSKGTYGTSGWMDRKELSEVLELVSDLRHHYGTVLGLLDGKAVCVPEKTRLNSNIAVYGASGSMKTRSFCLNRILQGAARGESLIICDPKSELYEKSSEYLRDLGYCVKIFNLVEPENSDASGSNARIRRTEAPVLTLENRGEIETDESREDAIWHEIHNAYRTRKILTGQLGDIEQTDNGKTIVIVDYKGFRIVIPLKEMMINVGRSPSREEYRELMLRQNKILGNMLGAEIDFLVRGIDSKTRSVVASRKEAMLKKRQIFYFDTDSAGMYRIYEGRIVQARVIAVAEKVIRVEVFGVECSIMARDLAWDWIGDAHERFSVGDQVLVRILSVRRDSVEDLGIKADIKSVSQNNNHDNLKKCRIQSKYAGKVTDVHKGVVYIRLSNGVNAVSHSCYDYRTPGKKDDVSFAVTHIDEERGVAVGIITRIIRQNL